MNVLELTGRWQAGLTRDSDGLTYHPNVIYAANGDAIASVYEMPHNVTLEKLDPERYAQPIHFAKLIAAAPELQHALTELLGDIEQWAKDFGYADHGARTRAAALLARLDAK